MLKSIRKYHKWFSLFATLFILFFAVSGIILNHRDLFSGIDISRKLLPRVYRYQNWNLASIKGVERFGRDSVLVFGNVGIWLTDSSFHRFADFNAGFPEGIDNRKVHAVHYSPNTGLYAGTLFGLFRYDFIQKQWRSVPVPSDNERIVRISSIGDSLLVMSRSYLMVGKGERAPKGLGHPVGVEEKPTGFCVIPIPGAEGSDGKVGLFRTLWVLHSGEIYGFAGKLIVDFIGLVFILLCITGLIYFIVPYRLKYLREGFRRVKLKRFNRQSLKWHNFTGSWLIAVLILTTLTGMFLRPPLLIPIANARVNPIPFSELDSRNPWFDKLRDFYYDEDSRQFIIATNEGIFSADPQLSKKLRPFIYQPPVSVMGINVLEKVAGKGFLVGSFSGIFMWDPESGQVRDYVTKMPYTGSDRGGPPFGAVSVAGYLRVNDSTEIVFDYAKGAMAVSGRNPIPAMTREIIQSSPISLWNTALEIHTGRIFEPLMGDFYILVVPLIGIMTLIIVISGFLSWWLGRRARRSKMLKQQVVRN